MLSIDIYPKLTFLLLISMLVGIIQSVYAADAKSLEQGLKSAEEWKQSFTKVGYYTLGKEEFEFKLVADSNQGETEEFEWINNKGEHFLISKEALIESKDIDGILIEKSTYYGEEEYKITFYFNKTSWDRIYDTTKMFEIKTDKDGIIDNEKLRKMAIVIGGNLLLAPNIHGALTEKTVLSGNFDSSAINSITEKLVAEEEPSQVEREQEYVEWLETRVHRFPDDINIMIKLANYYYVSKEKDCEKAVTLYENLLYENIIRKNHRSDIMIVGYHKDLHSCYRSLKQFDRAIKTYKTLARGNDEVEGLIRISLAEMYAAKGDFDKALIELEKAKDLLKVLLNNQSFKEQFEKVMTQIKSEINKNNTHNN